MREPRSQRPFYAGSIPTHSKKTATHSSLPLRRHPITDFGQTTQKTDKPKIRRRQARPSTSVAKDLYSLLNVFAALL